MNDRRSSRRYRPGVEWLEDRSMPSATPAVALDALVFQPPASAQAYKALDADLLAIASDAVAPDASGSGTPGTTTRTYTTPNDQDLPASTETIMDTTNPDGSTFHQDVTVTYSYDGYGDLIGASGQGTFKSDDGWGNTTQGTITQTYVIINGEAKLATMQTVSDTTNLDGSTSHTDMTVTYSYDANGDLIGASGQGTSSSDDGWGNTTQGTITQTYVIIDGEAKLATTRTVNDTINLDCSTSHQDVTISYTYDANGNLVSASGQGTFSSDDGWGNVTQGTITQTYVIINGEAKLATTQTVSDTTNLDGSTSHQDMTDSYTYDANGKLLSASGQGTFNTDDGWGNVSQGTITQTYTIVQGQAKLTTTRTISNNTDLDGSTSNQNMTITNSYDANGKLLGASGQGISTADDGWGNTAQGTITQTYMISNGQTKLVTAESISDTTNLDGSTSHEDVTLQGSYDMNGCLMGVSGSGTGNADDGWGNTSQGTSTLTYILINGQAKLMTAEIITPA